LGNAVKFTESGEVELKLTFTPKDEMSGLFNFSVRDTGIGISKAQQLKLFKAFSQADTSTTRKFGGTGLGLTISNMIAEKMGSKIELLSEPDLGANFYFTLETGYEYGENTDSGSLSDIKRVLVIDDNENNRIILEHTFKYWDVECVATDNGLSGLKLIEQSKPFDVVIIDYHMPYLNGIDTIKMIRGQLKLSPEILPIILLHSSADDMKIYDECKKLGVRFNLTKPVKSQELLHYLKNTNTLPEKNKKALSKNSLFQKSFQNAPVILVAEDVVINMLLITTVIRQMVPNAEILEAKNGKEAFEIMTKQRPALIFMDLQMPEMDGIEATQEIRNFEKGIGSHIPIIALTAGAIKGEEEKCRNAGMDDFITKPIAQIKLYEILKRYLSIAPTEKEKIAEHELLLHFDKTVLEQRIGNNAEIWKELTGSVLIEIPMYFESLRHAINQENRVEIQKINHTIKGISLNMCFDRLAGLAKKIELILTNNGPGKPDVIFKQMVLEWEQIESIIKEPEMQ
jgi:CheY-like chemotaxis protein/HPt (histidine-containing phosphotransfer) domain-containing protein